MKETRGNVNLVGDKHMRNKAIGKFQIRKPYLVDANKIIGKKNLKKICGKSKLTMQDMKNDKLSKLTLWAYLSNYGNLYTRKTGKVPTLEVYARIHNGGPNGWKNPKTKKYGKDVVKIAETFNKKRTKGKG